MHHGAANGGTHAARVLRFAAIRVYWRGMAGTKINHEDTKTRRRTKIMEWKEVGGKQTVARAKGHEIKYVVDTL